MGSLQLCVTELIIEISQFNYNVSELLRKTRIINNQKGVWEVTIKIRSEINEI